MRIEKDGSTQHRKGWRIRMKSEWRVMSNPIGDEMRYGVYRLYDKQKVMHSGNMEIAGYYDCEEDAEREAERRNAEGDE